MYFKCCRQLKAATEVTDDNVSTFIWFSIYSETQNHRSQLWRRTVEGVTTVPNRTMGLLLVLTVLSLLTKLQTYKDHSLCTSK